MKSKPLAERLALIVNLKAFAQQAKMHRRTLQRIINAENAPNAATVALVEQKLKEIGPEMRKAAK